MIAAALYRMYDDKGVLLYIGCSAQLPARLQQHARDKGWWPAVTRVDVQHFDDADLAFEAEKEAIASESPAYNITHKTLTADEIAARRERHAETRAKNLRDYYRRDAGPSYWSPEEGEVIRCGNCGREPERFPRGRQLSETPCKRCGVEAFERSAA